MTKHEAIILDGLQREAEAIKGTLVECERWSDWTASVSLWRAQCSSLKLVAEMCADPRQRAAIESVIVAREAAMGAILKKWGLCDVW
jgi:hypothetical protein